MALTIAKKKARVEQRIREIHAIQNINAGTIRVVGGRDAVDELNELHSRFVEIMRDAAALLAAVLQDSNPDNDIKLRRRLKDSLRRFDNLLGGESVDRDEAVS